MNLSYEQKVLIKDIFNVRVSRQEGSSSMMLVENFIKQFGSLGSNASLVQNSTYYDSLLMEILSVPETDILSYLQTCLARCYNVIEKPWNQTQLAQNFIKYSEQIIKNFIYLSQCQFQIFPYQMKIDQDSLKVPDISISIAMRLMTHFERRGVNMELFNIFYPKLDQQNNCNFVQAFFQVLVARQRFQTISDSKAFFYLSTLQALVSQPQLKTKFMRMTKMPFLPMQKQKVQGSMVQQSPLGLFFRLSILGHKPGPYYQQNQAYKRYIQKIKNQVGKQRFGKQRIKYFVDLQNQFYNKFTDITKIFLRKQSQKEFLQWCYGAILGNIGKTKLGSRLQSARNLNLSSDGFLINLYMCFLNLCKPIFNIENGKYNSINPEYYMYNERAKMCKYEKFNKKQVPLEYKNVQFGTITQFFFLAFQFLHIGVIPTHQNFVEQMQLKQKLKKMLEKFPANHPMRARYEQQLTMLNAKNVTAYIVLMQENMINPTIKLFDLLLYMLPGWLGINYQQLLDCRLQRKYQPNKLAYFLPQHLIQSIHKFHIGVYNFKQNYMSLISQKHIHQLLKLTCLILSQQAILSNPYVGANMLELIFYFLYQSKTGIMYQAFKTNAVCHKNLTYGLMKFYCDIAVTGHSHQFYTKFKYRQFVNRIFMALWAHQVYRDNLKSYFKTEVFQRFLNMVMGDTTYCFDETNQKYQKYKQLENKKQTGKLTQQQQRNQEQLSNQIQSTLHQSTSNIKLLKQLSRWSPETFFNEAFLVDIVMLLNHILQTFVEPTTFASNRVLLLKYKFEKDVVLSNVVQTYVNLNVSEKFASVIVKDARYYKKEYFMKALQRASNEHQTDIATLEKFEQLISKLQAPMDEQLDDQQIYGQIPQKYLCNLMSTLMRDPVQLPSGYIVDRVYIHKHLLNDQRDPFTRAPLKNGEWKQLKGLKDQIAVWKKKRMEELKGANKAVKYGKIGQNKKQQQQQSLYDGENKIINYEDEESM